MDEERERRIRERAYRIWERTGSADRQSVGNWLQAEREIDEEDARETEKLDAVAVAGITNPH